MGLFGFKRKDKEHWFKSTESFWSFLSAVVTLGALIVSIVVMIDQRKMNKENLQLSKTISDQNIRLSTQQLLLSQAQFDSSNNDRNEANRDLLKKFRYQDSLNKRQMMMSMKDMNLKQRQLDLQKYLSDLQFEKDKPIIHIDSMWYPSKNSLVLTLTNTGVRPILCKTLQLTIADTDSLINLTTKKMTNLEMKHNKGVLIEFELDSIRQKILNITENPLILDIYAKDIILQQEVSFVFGLDAAPYKEDGKNLAVMVYDNLQVMNFLRKFYNNTSLNKKIYLKRKELLGKELDSLYNGIDLNGEKLPN